MYAQVLRDYFDNLIFKCFSEMFECEVFIKIHLFEFFMHILKQKFYFRKNNVKTTEESVKFRLLYPQPVISYTMCIHFSQFPSYLAPLFPNRKFLFNISIALFHISSLNQRVCYCNKYCFNIITL